MQKLQWHAKSDANHEVLLVWAVQGGCLDRYRSNAASILYSILESQGEGEGRSISGITDMLLPALAPLLFALVGYAANVPAGVIEGTGHTVGFGELKV